MTIHDVTCSARRHEHVTFTQTGQNHGLSRAVVLFLFLLFVYVSLLLHRPSRTSGGRHRAANRTEEQTDGAAGWYRSNTC